jgi:hypothetical protein
MDLEARAHSEHPDELRLWLRLLTCTQQIERQVRAGLREQFDTTLPRFDLMAQLELVAEGLVERTPVEGDRRAFRVRLTAKGRSQFNAMAEQHAQWIVDAFSSLGVRDVATLHRLLGKVKQHTMSNFLETP